MDSELTEDSLGGHKLVLRCLGGPRQVRVVGGQVVEHAGDVVLGPADADGLGLLLRGGLLVEDGLEVRVAGWRIGRMRDF